MITIRVKTKTGHIQPMQVESIIDIDGKPYNPGGEGGHQECREQIAYLSGRIDQLDRLLNQDAVSGQAIV